MPDRKLTICLVSDFFCPNTGGVETHIYYLAQCLIRRGHRVIVLTHAYPERKGLRLLSNGLKVYYVPLVVFYNGATVPTVVTTGPWVRWVLLREAVEVVHGHSSFSSLAHETLLHAAELRLSTVFTDHSLFGFADASAIVTNKILEWSLCHVQAVVCVSHTSKENTVLRARIPPARVSVIPNAVHCPDFRPDAEAFRSRPLTVVVLSRLVYRKGTDLLATVIPDTCAAFPGVRFVVGGDGPKRVLLEEVRERAGLQERVLLLGTVPHSQVRSILAQGHVFLNTSLTEAFCMAIVEAASCGLHVVTTRVGGIPEVLPPDLMTLAEPTADDLTAALASALRCFLRAKARDALPDPWATHRRVAAMYNWPDVAERVERVYERVLRLPALSRAERMGRYRACGWGFGAFFALFSLLNALIFRLLSWLEPLLPKDARARAQGFTAQEAPKDSLSPSSNGISLRRMPKAHSVAANGSASLSGAYSDSD